jgi:hypothetical protein
MGAVAVDTLQQLENAAAIYTADQEKTPVSFTAFVTHDSNKMTEEGSTLVLDLSSLGNKKGRPCEIQPDKIRCSGGKPDSRFPDLPGDVTYSFNQGPGTFSIYCDGGDPSPTGWNPEKCKIEK